MIILCTVDITTREVTIPSDQRIASYDHKVDVIRFQVETIPGFSLDTSSIKIAAQGPNKARHDYAVDPATVQIEEETGYITFDWPIPAGVTEMPIGTFKYGDKGQLIFAVCAEIISGDIVSKAWHSDDGIITVVAHLEPESGGGEDPEEEATNAQKIAQLQTDVTVMGTQVGGYVADQQKIAEKINDWLEDNPDRIPGGKVVTVSSSGAYRTVDDTYANILSAIASGRTVVVTDGGTTPYPYVGMMSQDGVPVLAFGVSATYNQTAVLSGYLIFDFDSNTRAIYVNQMTELYSKSEIDSMIGDIETLLASI